MTETLSRLAPSAMERARLKEGVHIERSPRRVRTYFGGKLIAVTGSVAIPNLTNHRYVSLWYG
jgi:hypothetical protein